MTDENIARISNAWIEVTSDPDRCSDDLFELGFSLNTLSYDDPETAWLIILNIKDAIDSEFFSDSFEGRINIAANLASGPLETLLAQHGTQFINRLEQASLVDDRFCWLLTCVWQNSMPDEIWKRVQKAANNTSR